ncbi:MAG: glycosyltransferase family 4 protein, partial [Firmicutes bacterium]|nr:glycosyltransferase family 4 protein [Bacillota bacterium]
NINGALNGYYADRAIAVAEAARQNLIDTGVSPDKITVILNGVDGYRKYGGDEKISAKEEFGVPDNNRVVSIVGRIEEIKGHEYFIKAADTVLRDTENVTFLIVGTGSLEEKYKGLVRSLGRDGDIIFTGYTDKTEAIMNITDIIVNASFGTEATSLSLLEAMSVGVPAVVSDFGGNTGVIDEGKNGFVVPQRDEAALALALKRLLADEELYGQMSVGALRIFGEKFTSIRMTAETEALYLDVIKEKRERSKHGH